MDTSRYIGIDIGGTKTAVSLGSADGRIIDSITFVTQEHYQDVLDEIYTHVEAFIAEADTSVRTIGISCGGPLDSKKGVILSPPNLPSWRNVPITGLISDRFRVPVYLENDANACALAEWYWGNGKGLEHLLFLTFGTGLGAGLILNGHLFSGADGLAGEIGHVRMADDGPLSYRKHGSWESFCSGGGISLLYEERFSESLSAKDVCIRAEQGDQKALEVVKISSTYLGKGLAMLIDIFNPEAVIIGSIFTRSEKLFRPTVEKIIASEALEQSAGTCRILPAGLGDRLGDHAALGVAINGERERRNA
jgi:glucokinase